MDIDYFLELQTKRRKTFDLILNGEKMYLEMESNSSEVMNKLEKLHELFDKFNDKSNLFIQNFYSKNKLQDLDKEICQLLNSYNLKLLKNGFDAFICVH